MDVYCTIVCHCRNQTCKSSLPFLDYMYMYTGQLLDELRVYAGVETGGRPSPVFYTMARES